MNMLVHKAQKGDKNAFLELIQPLEKKIFVIAKSKLDNMVDIEDVIQETILSSYKNIKKLKDSEKFEAWIIRILINNCNQYYKSKKNVVQIPMDDNVEFADEQNLYDVVDKNIDFFKYVELLDVDDRDVFILYYSDDYTTKQISEILNINENTIKTKLRRSRQKVQDYIERWSEYGKQRN